MPKEKYFNAWRNQKPTYVLSTQPLPNPVVFTLTHNDLWGIVRGIRALSVNNGSLKFEITAKRLYAASQRVL